MILTLKLKIQAPQTLGLHKEMGGDQNVIRPLKIFIGRCGPPPSAVSTAREVGPTGQHRSVRGYLREGGEGGSKQERRKKIEKMGVEKQVLRPGTGPKPIAGQSVTVHCTGFGLSLFLSFFLIFVRT